ncbi:MAG: cyclic nucleotide-binding domain-containing protein [bacterium]|nr:cyclic nucleotide-binding domain-containing protein [bacterium]
MFETLVPLLKKHPFLKDLSEEYIERLVSCAKNVRFNQDEYICREGQEAESFYLIREGRAAIEIYSPVKGSIRIQTIEAGDVLGWSWLFAPYRWHFDIRAIEPIRAFEFDGKCLRSKCEEDHDLGYELMKRFARLMEERLQATRLQLLDMYGEK